MRLTLLYPEAREIFATGLRIALGRIRNLDLSSVATQAESFQEDLSEGSEDADALLLILDASLINAKLPPRTVWKPLLEKIERGESTKIGLITIGSMQLPKLLDKIRSTGEEHATRMATNWALNWLGNNLAITQPPDTPLFPLVDRSVVLELPHLDTQDCLRQLRPYFESVEILEAHQQSAPLLDAELGRIRPQGRTLYIVEGHNGPLPPLPEHASILHLRHVTPPVIPNAIAHAAKLIPQIPNIENQPLPFSTWRFEHLLPVLFEQNWQLAERLARRAGTFFRLNHRVNEAIWLYETLRDAAAAQGQTTCAEYAAHELEWLRAGGEVKQKLLNASQGSLFF